MRADSVLVWLVRGCNSIFYRMANPYDPVVPSGLRSSRMADNDSLC